MTQASSVIELSHLSASGRAASRRPTREEEVGRSGCTRGCCEFTVVLFELNNPNEEELYSSDELLRY